MAKGTKDPDLDRGLPPDMPVSWTMSGISSCVIPEMSMATCSTPLTASSETARGPREEAGDQHRRQG